MSLELNQSQQEAFLELMLECGAHRVYPATFFVERLAQCGIAATAVKDTGQLRLGSVTVSPVEPEWGDPGIYPPNIVAAVIEDYGFTISSDMTGRGFRLRDILSQLAAKWQIERHFD